MAVWLTRAISLAAVLAVLAVGSATSVLAARPPSQVELVSEFEIDRKTDDPCQIAVPTSITGTITLTIDFVEGTAQGWIEGTGAGAQGVPPSCSGRDGTDEYRAETTFAGPISRDADDVLSGTNLMGWVDAATGEFLAHAIIEISGTGYHGIAGKTYQCAGSDGLQSECPIGQIVTPQPAFITGRVLTGLAPEIHVDWYTNFCGTAAGDGVTWGRAGCPTGTRVSPAVASSVPAANAPPVINAVLVDPLNPDAGDAVNLRVEAMDPDGDPLSYSWDVEDLASSDGSQAIWQPESGRQYTIVVRVEDDMGGADEESTTIDVFLPPPATTATDDAASIPADPDADAFPDDRPDAALSTDQSAPAADQSKTKGGWLGDIPLWVIVLVAVMGGLLALGLLLRGWDRAEGVWNLFTKKRPPETQFGAAGAGAGHVKMQSDADLLDSNGAIIGTLLKGQDYRTAGTVTAVDGSSWAAIELPNGISGWVRSSEVTAVPEWRPPGPTGMASDTTYQYVTVPAPVTVDIGHERVQLPAGQHVMSPPLPDGSTVVFYQSGQPFGTISNLDNPTLQPRSFPHGPLIESRSGDSAVVQRAPPGSYLLGPADSHGFALIYDTDSGVQLGLHKVGGYEDLGLRR
jgi:hypothetical protein